MADGLRCCIWGRAQNPGSISLHLTKGWGNMRNFRIARAGNLGLSMVDLAWTPDRGVAEPLLHSLMPTLQYLPQKLVHFLLDYHPAWIAGLGLAPSDGTHSQLHSEHFAPVLERLVTMPDVDGIIQLFSAVNIGHKEWKGSQTVHAVPFPKTKTRMVHATVCLYMSVYARICMYMNVYVCICMYLHVYAHIRTYMYIYVCICKYMFVYTRIIVCDLQDALF